MKKTIKSNNAKVRKLVRSAVEDEIVEDEDDELASEDMGDMPDEGSEDTDGFDIDEDIVDEINENDDFGGEELAKEDIIDAIKVIDEIATAVTEKEGDGAEMDADTVLNKVEEFTEDAVDEDGMDDLDFGEDIPDEIANSVVRVMVQDENSDVAVDTEPTVESIYTDVVEETPATVYDTDMSADDVELDGEDDTDAEDDELLVVGNSRATSFKKGVIKLNSALARKNPMNWKKAYSKVTSSLKGKKKVLSAADWALIQMLAQAYNKELSDKMINVKRVVSAMKKSTKLKSLLQSELDLVNDTQADGAHPFDDRGQPESETKPEEIVGSTTGEVDENVGDGQAGELESTFGDPEVQVTTTEEAKEGDYMNDPNGTIELLTLPIDNSAQTVVLKKVGTNTYVGCGYIPTKETKIKLVKSNANVMKTAKANDAITNSLDGKVVTFKDGTAILLKSSNIYGLLACRAEFSKGIKGAKYEVFKKIGSSFVSNGVAITSSCEGEYLIASSTSNKSARKTNEVCENVFASLEKELHRREILLNSMKLKSENRKLVKNSMDKDKQISMLSSEVRRARNENRRLEKLANGTEATVRAQVAERDREALFASSQKQMCEENTAIKNSSEHNVNHMAKMMGRIFG